MGVGWQVVVAHRVVEHGGELVADAAQVRVAVVEAVGCALVLDGVLPVQDVQRRDLRELLLHVPAIDLVEGAEGHVRRSLHLAQEVHFPCGCRLLGLEAELRLLAALAGPVLVPALDVVGSALRVLANGHRGHRPCRSSVRRSSLR